MVGFKFFLSLVDAFELETDNVFLISLSDLEDLTDEDEANVNFSFLIFCCVDLVEEDVGFDIFLILLLSDTFELDTGSVLDMSLTDEDGPGVFSFLIICCLGFAEEDVVFMQSCFRAFLLGFSLVEQPNSLWVCFTFLVLFWNLEFGYYYGLKQKKERNESKWSVYSKCYEICMEQN